MKDFIEVIYINVDKDDKPIDDVKKIVIDVNDIVCMREDMLVTKHDMFTLNDKCYKHNIGVLTRLNGE